MSNEYELDYVVPKSGAGTIHERIEASSEMSARALLRAKFGNQEVRIFSGRQTRFGDRTDRHADRR